MRRGGGVCAVGSTALTEFYGSVPLPAVRMPPSDFSVMSSARGGPRPVTDREVTPPRSLPRSACRLAAPCAALVPASAVLNRVEESIIWWVWCVAVLCT